MTRVFCDVSNCTFNEDDFCTAREIKVSTQSLLQQSPEPEFALGGGAAGMGMSVLDEARSSQETVCVTFRPRKARDRS